MRQVFRFIWKTVVTDLNLGVSWKDYCCIAIYK